LTTMQKSSLAVLSPKLQEFLLDVGMTIVPEVADLDESGKDNYLSIIDHALAGREKAVRFQFIAFLNLLRYSTLIRYGRTLGKLSQDKQTKVLTGFQNSGNAKFRSGFWGMRTLILMGYYGDADRWAMWNYTPGNDGNKRLGDQ